MDSRLACCGFAGLKFAATMQIYPVCCGYKYFSAGTPDITAGSLSVVRQGQ